MRILGVDPGIGRTGWGIIDIENSKLKIVDCGCVETRAGTNVENRLLTISLEIESLIKEYKPDVLSIEELFFSTNAKTAFIVGQARGVVLLLAAKNKLEVSIYTPLQVKMALTGYGRADKNQIAQMVKVILKLEKIPKIDDTSDALAVAITHAFSAKLKNLNIRN